MKVEGPSRTQAAGKTKKSDKAGETEGSFGDFIASAPQKAGPAGPTQSIARVDALLAAQAVEDPAQRAARQRMQARADNLLKELEKIKLCLLAGTLTVGHMIDIADTVAAHREKIADARLTAILDEIDLRAQIELAKMRKALEAASPAS